MIKDKRGTKRLCESCGKKFYDLGREPIVCPLCETPFIIEKPKPKPKPKARPAPEPAPADKAAEPQADAAPAPKDDAPSPKDDAPSPQPEFVSLEDAAGEEEGDDEAKLADLGDDEEDIPPDENQDVFIEDDEEDSESKVTEIIGTSIKTKDET